MYLMSKSIKKLSIVISLIITITFFSSFNIFYKNRIFPNRLVDKTTTIDIATGRSQNIIEYINKKCEYIDRQIDIDTINNKSWVLKIEKIDLEAQISDGTTTKVLNKYIGHFKETSKDSGNIGLAAHNRGYEVNYFSKIKSLKSGDVIKYFYNGERYVYEVYKNYIILDTDWSVLETQQNEITLITCVENKPSYRRCVKGKLIKID